MIKLSGPEFQKKNKISKGLAGWENVNLVSAATKIMT